MKPSVHKLQKKLRREQQHELWLRKNLKSSKQHWECRKNILKLRTNILVTANCKLTEIVSVKEQFSLRNRPND